MQIQLFIIIIIFGIKGAKLIVPTTPLAVRTHHCEGVVIPLANAKSGMNHTDYRLGNLLPVAKFH